MRIMLDDGAIMPTRAHADDAGLDLYSPKETLIPPSGSAVIDTGVHLEIPRGYVGLVLSKSGLNIKRGLTSEGVIDAGYTGSIRVKLYNHLPQPYQVLAGDKVSQLVILPIVTPELELADRLGETERGANGFGSSGR